MKPATLAEQRLLAAAKQHRLLDFRADNEQHDTWRPTAEQAQQWGDDRVVRAVFLKHLLVDRGLPVQMKGARIDGDLDLSKSASVTLSASYSVFAGNAWFEDATFDGDAWFDEATFGGDAGFGKATFDGSAWFGGATFGGDAGFDGATFGGYAGFSGATFGGYAGFGKATFGGSAWFDGATFGGSAWFGKATFGGAAWFGKATFGGAAWFGKATFGESAWFVGATFGGDAGFDGATFGGAAWFGKATFGESAWFVGATFGGAAGFGKATFGGPVRFTEVRGVYSHLDFNSSRWKTALVEASDMEAGSVSFVDAVIEESVRFDLTCRSVDLTGLQSRKRLHLVVGGEADVTCASADFGAGSRIEGVPSLAGKAPRVVSLSRAQLAGVTLSGLDLTGCRFGGADGLDSLVIDSTNTLPLWRRSDPSRGWKWWRTNRRMIADELTAPESASPNTTVAAEVRGDAVGKTTTNTSPPGDSAGSDTTTTEQPAHHERAAAIAAPSQVQGAAAGSVAETYRVLRKALEDNKDHAGAADFYYGEMEMRRRAAPLDSVEWWLLTAYRTVSGYGLRAWRAVTALAAVIGVAGLLFSFECLARLTTTSAIDKINVKSGEATYLTPDEGGLPWWRATLFAAQETVALFRTNQTGVTLVGFGYIVDLAVRILGPVLLALAIMAIRNRTKR
ncbi:pentapeptide repeat-containing protein [Gordonia phosphorivorans]|uniref:Pentapeptide repeat-containing protein n=1 Tax=Gordonia phosphorivorans TaxID=1056982 RepID=A0ABV6H4B6_9ACTN